MSEEYHSKGEWLYPTTRTLIENLPDATMRRSCARHRLTDSKLQYTVAKRVFPTLSSPRTKPSSARSAVSSVSASVDFLKYVITLRAWEIT